MGLFSMTKHLDVTLHGTLLHMCKSMQVYLDPTWVIPIRYIDLDSRRGHWNKKIMINPHGIEMVDKLNNFFDMVSGVSNMMYFKSQQIALNRRNEEKEVNLVLHHTYGIALDVDLGEGVRRHVVTRKCP